MKSFWYLIVLLLFGCVTQRGVEREKQRQIWFQDNGKLKVLNTTPIINDMIKRIGGEFIDTTSLIEGALDPHSYQLVKGDNEKLLFADVIFYNGLNLEHGPSLYHYLLDNPKAFSLGDTIDSQNPDCIIVINGQKDPHIWMDPNIFSKSIPFIVHILSQKDPVHAADYAKNGQQLQNELISLDAEIKRIINILPPGERYLVTSHDAFNYFTKAYLALPEEVTTNTWRERFAAPEGLAPESQLSSVDIREIVNHLKRYHIHVVFSESNVSQDSLRKVVDAAHSEEFDVSIVHFPLYGDAMGEKGSNGDSYFKMLTYDARLLAEYLSHNKGVYTERDSKS